MSEISQGRIFGYARVSSTAQNLDRQLAELVKYVPEENIVTDTHCIRLSNRIGLVDNIKEPKKVEMELWKIVPPEEGNDLCHRLVNHGRDVCTARTKPYCDRCCLNDICARNGL